MTCIRTLTFTTFYEHELFSKKVQKVAQNGVRKRVPADAHEHNVVKHGDVEMIKKYRNMRKYIIEPFDFIFAAREVSGILLCISGTESEQNRNYESAQNTSQTVPTSH